MYTTIYSPMFHVLKHGDSSDFHDWLCLWAWCREQLKYPNIVGELGQWQGVRVVEGF